MTARDVWRIDSEAEYWAHVRKWLMPLARADADLYKLLMWYSLEMLQRKIHIDPATMRQYIDIGGEDDEIGEELIMTMAKYLREEGRTEGLLEGRTEGLLEGHTKGLVEGHTKGLLEGHTEAARRLISKGFDNGMVHEITGLPLSDIEQLRNGSERGGD